MLSNKVKNLSQISEMDNSKVTISLNNQIGKTKIVKIPTIFLIIGWKYSKIPRIKIFVGNLTFLQEFCFKNYIENWNSDRLK